MISKNFTYAVIGASLDQDKYGFKVLKDLVDAGYRAVPINPTASEIFGLKAYPSVLNYPDQIDVAIFVVPPHVSQQIMPELIEKNIKKVWFQPGSESEQVEKICRKNKIDYVANACIMIERQKMNE